MAFKLKLEPLAKWDIQQEINYYNSKQKGLGKRFYSDVKAAFTAIKKNPFFQVRYDNVHCLPLKIFPAMVHFTINEAANTIVVRAVINTHKDPDTNWMKD
jgi:toxin ParE1/3/4